MSQNVCSSCGQLNEGAQVYCSHCGSILSKAPASNGDNPLPTSVAVAARRVKRQEEVTVKKTSFLSHLLSVLLHIAAVVVGVIAVLALMSPKETKPKAPQVNQSASVQIARTLSASRYTPSTLPEVLINAYLQETGRITWNPPFPGFPVPEWISTDVELLPGTVSYRIKVSMFGYPLVFSETFALGGRAMLYTLVPQSGSVGLLPLNQSLLFLITPFMHLSSEPFARELKELEEARSLEIRAGSVQLLTR
jgi:hypothetical protein